MFAGTPSKPEDMPSSCDPFSKVRLPLENCVQLSPSPQQLFFFLLRLYAPFAGDPPPPPGAVAVQGCTYTEDISPGLNDGE